MLLNFDLRYTYWVFLALIYLLYLTIEDYRKKGVVDDRKNWLMLGVTISLFSHFPMKWYMSLSLILFVIVMGLIGRKIKAFGEADLNTFTWLFLGLGIISFSKLIAFLIILSVITIMFILMKKFVFRIKKDIIIPYYSVILIAFIAGVYLLKLY